jgi:DNA polymerase III subunit chi
MGEVNGAHQPICANASPRAREARGEANLMTEVLFYHLEKRSLDDVLPGLIERTLARGWRALIRPESAERAQAIDNLLWTWSEESFLPHAQAGNGDAASQPVLIDVEEGNRNRADVLFLVGGALPGSWKGDTSGFARIVILFDGRDALALSAVRTAWATAKESGHETTYWKQSAAGKWEKQS